MCASFVLLANSATSDKVVDKYGKPRPPKIAFNNGLGTETSEVAREGRGMNGVKERGPSGRWYIHPTFIVEVSIVESPVGERGMWEERGIIGQVLNGLKYEGIRGRRRLDVSGEGEIEGVDNCRLGNNGGVVIIGGGINLSIAGKGVSGSEFSTREDLPNDIEVL